MTEGELLRSIAIAKVSNSVLMSYRQRFDESFFRNFQSYFNDCDKVSLSTSNCHPFDSFLTFMDGFIAQYGALPASDRALPVLCRHIARSTSSSVCEQGVPPCRRLLDRSEPSRVSDSETFDNVPSRRLTQLRSQLSIVVSRVLQRIHEEDQLRPRFVCQKLLPIVICAIRIYVFYYKSLFKNSYFTSASTGASQGSSPRASRRPLEAGSKKGLSPRDTARFPALLPLV
jgi:hypothetical protein